MTTVRVGTASDAGRVRTSNEDSVFTGTRVFVVADGMGGHAAGEVASGIAVQRLARLGEHEDLTPEALREELSRVNEDILASAGRHSDRTGMGTTVAGLGVVWFAGSEHWVVFNVGDSRVYRFTGDSLVQLTTDHSEVGELVAAGAIDAAQARTHARRHIITRALGMDPAPDADVWLFPQTPGERFLICSDGLHTELTDDEIATVLRADTTPQHAADVLVRRAVQAGGRDNVTVVVVDHLRDDEGDADGETLPPAAKVGPAE